MQVKLLRVLQERSFERVGSNKTMPLQCAHHCRDASRPGRGHQRGTLSRGSVLPLNVFPVQMPPLRERLEDLPVLIEHLVQRQGQSAARSIRLDKDAMNCLARNPGRAMCASWRICWSGWRFCFPRRPSAPPICRSVIAAARPWVDGEGSERAHRRSLRARRSSKPCISRFGARRGEVCELRGGGTASARRAGGVRTLDADLPRGGIDLKDHLSAIEIGLIRKALEEADGTVAEAARLLRIRRTTLVEKLRKYRLSA
jgi:sigma-54 specific flagellar transcriptional regulator A